MTSRSEDAAATYGRQLHAYRSRYPAFGWNILSMPFIYAVVAPLALLDVVVSLYQSVCFRIWSIPLSARSEYIRFDRHKLRYLNALQRVNCAYCSYAQGVLAYAVDIASKTEKYWCPIQHEEPPVAPHSRYRSFLIFGDGADLEARWNKLRLDLESEERD